MTTTYDICVTCYEPARRLRNERCDTCYSRLRHLLDLISGGLSLLWDQRLVVSTAARRRDMLVDADMAGFSRGYDRALGIETPKPDRATPRKRRRYARLRERLEDLRDICMPVVTTRRGLQRFQTEISVAVLTAAEPTPVTVLHPGVSRPTRDGARVLVAIR